jgi:two-component system sensor histidine kinase DctS
VRLEPGDGELAIAVADNGCGISPEAREKMFTAFFTTKPEGMGVGLSICRSIIEFHRGRLWAEDNAASPAGRGTIFRFTLPLEPA